MNSFAFFLGLHRCDLTFSQVLLMALIATMAKMLVDGDLWPFVRDLFRLLWHVVQWPVGVVVGRYRCWSMKRMLMKHSAMMVRQQTLLRQNIDRLKAMERELYLLKSVERSVQINRTVERLKMLDGLLTQKGDQMNEVIAKIQ